MYINKKDTGVSNLITKYNDLEIASANFSLFALAKLLGIISLKRKTYTVLNIVMYLTDFTPHSSVEINVTSEANAM
jgi:hypothetical protein